VFDVEAILTLDSLADHALACGVEMALWDLIARAARQPLHHLLGGAYRSSVPLCARLPDGSTDMLAQWSRALAAQGITSQILSTTGSVDDDWQLVSAVREACSDRVQLRLDAQCRYDLRGALELCQRLETDSVQFVVDPVSAPDPERLAIVGSTSRVLLAVSAALERPADIMQLARNQASSYVMVDPVLVGGLSRTRDCAAVAEAAGMAATLRIEGTSGLAVAASLHVAAATPGFVSGHGCSYPHLQADILTEPLRMVDGLLLVPTAPGLGVEVDREKVERYQVHR
jgi:L-alanine-DL-glutamate epimerase-like enolase superfamily enzyme